MSQAMLNFINRAMAPLKRRVSSMISRCVLESVKDDGGIQLVKISLLAGETKEDVERFQQYGLTSRPKAGAEGACLFVGGGRDHGIVIAMDDRTYRLKGLADGEVALYSDEGDHVWLKRGNEIEVKTKTLTVNAESKVEVTTPEAKVISPTVEIGAAALQKVLNGELFQTFFNAHVHQGNLFYPTGPPMVPSNPAHLSTQVKAGS